MTELHKQILELASNGLKYREIGELLGISHVRVGQVCRRHGKRRNKSKHSLEEADQRVRFRCRRTHAKQSGIPWDVNYEDIYWPKLCPILGIPLNYTGSRGQGPKEDSPSIDRIDSNKGYTKENIHVISSRANRIKNDASLEELKLIVNFLEKKEFNMS